MLLFFVSIYYVCKLSLTSQFANKACCLLFCLFVVVPAVHRTNVICELCYEPALKKVVCISVVVLPSMYEIIFKET